MCCDERNNFVSDAVFSVDVSHVTPILCWPYDFKRGKLKPPGPEL